MELRPLPLVFWIYIEPMNSWFNWLKDLNPSLVLNPDCSFLISPKLESAWMLSVVPLDPRLHANTKSLAYYWDTLIWRRLDYPILQGLFRGILVQVQDILSDCFLSQNLSGALFIVWVLNPLSFGPYTLPSLTSVTSREEVTSGEDAKRFVTPSPTSPKSELLRRPKSFTDCSIAHFIRRYSPPKCHNPFPRWYCWMSLPFLWVTGSSKPT